MDAGQGPGPRERALDEVAVHGKIYKEAREETAKRQDELAAACEAANKLKIPQGQIGTRAEISRQRVGQLLRAIAKKEANDS